MLNRLIARFSGRKRLLSVLLYGLMNVLPQLTAAALAIIYTKVFTLSQYGVYAVLMASIALLGAISDLGLPSAIVRNYYDMGKESDLSARNYLSATFYGGRLLSVVALPVLGLLLYVFLGRMNPDGAHTSIYIAFLLAIVFLERSSAMLASFSRALEKPFHYASGRAGQAVVSLLFAYILVFQLRGGIVGALFAILLSRLAAVLIYGMVLSGDLEFRGQRFSWPLMKSCLSFGLPLVVNRLATWIRVSGPRPVLATSLPMSAVGVFSLGGAVANLPDLIPSAVDLAFSPYYYKRKVGGAATFPQKVRDFGTIMIALLVPCWTIFILFSAEILHVATSPKFAAAAPVCSILCLATFMRALQSFFVRQIHYLRQTWIFPVVAFPVGLASMLMIFILAPLAGILAAAWVVVFAEFAVTLALALVIRRYEALDHSLVPTVVSVAVLAAMTLWIVYAALPPGEWFTWVVKIGVLFLVTATSFSIWVWPNRDFIRTIARS